MQHDWRILPTPASGALHGAAHVVVAECRACGLVRSRAIARGSDHHVPFKGECPGKPG
jgi:hypothetical protein